MYKVFMSALFFEVFGLSYANSFSVSYSPFSEVAPISMEYTFDQTERFGVFAGLAFDVPNFSEEAFSVVVGPSVGVSYAFLREVDDYEVRAVFRGVAVLSFEEEFGFYPVANLGVSLRDFSGGVFEPIFEAGAFLARQLDYGVYVRLGVAR